MVVNKKHKASVFTALFSNPDTLRELYCALEGVSLPADVPVVINTLSNAIFMDRINDISFEIGGKLVVLIEHQSTINRSMALRLLLYIARIYEKIVLDKKIYSSKKIAIPRPEFFVLYNGEAPYPDEAVEKLSDMFETPGLPEKAGGPALELVVKVLNINAGKNEAVAKRCRTLAQYSAFIGKVREYEKSHGREEAVRQAVLYCRKHDILGMFLRENSSEVMSMLITEWNWDDAKEVWQEEAREEKQEEIARNALAEGASIEFVKKITGLDMAAIESLQKQLPE
jgi:hypothetical protein